MTRLVSRYNLAMRKLYVLGDKRDFEILEKIRCLEKSKLSQTDRQTLKLIKTQLKRDWRSPLMAFLNKLTRKYG